MIGVCVKHQTLLLLRRTCQLSLGSRKCCIAELIDHSPVRLGAMIRARIHEYMPRKAAEVCSRTPACGAGVGCCQAGAPVRCSRTEKWCKRWPGRMARLMHTLPPRYEKHMHVSIFLAFGPLTRSVSDDDAAQYIGASSLIIV
jgi:hypothetical protein